MSFDAARAVFVTLRISPVVLIFAAGLAESLHVLPYEVANAGPVFFDNALVTIDQISDVLLQ
jgi:hypothetical protein